MDQFLTATIRGLSQGSIYVMLGLGFVIVYRATSVVNLATPAIMVFGGVITSMAAVGQGWSFPLAVLVGAASTAALGLLLERVFMRPMVGESAFNATIVTIGILIVMTQVVNKMIGVQDRQIGLPLSDRRDQWNLGGTQTGTTPDGLATYDGGVTIFQREVLQIAVALVLVAALMLYLKRSRSGIAMRATALDQEVALAQGVNVGRMFGLSWAIAGALSSVAGVFVAAGQQGALGRTTAFVALKSLPAIILGGLDSVGGAVIGGFVIGLAESYTKIYQPEWVGANFDQVVPYLVMFVVLLVRPYGLFGTPEVERV